MKRHEGTAEPVARARSKTCLSAIGIMLVACLTIASGMIQGRMSNRWGVPPDMQAAGKKLEEFPSQFGSWRLQSSAELDEQTAKILECAGYFVRNYFNQDSGQIVQVAVFVGPSGPISLHTPEICYPSHAFEAQGERQCIAIPSADGTKDTFWAVTFQTNSLEADLLRVCYAWTSGRNWTATDDPRFAFAASPFLYKIQLVSPLPLGSDEEAADVCRQFLSDLLPVLRKHLVDSSVK